MQNQINEIQNDVSQIKDALLGNEFGNTGLIKRIESIEKKTGENKKSITNINSKSLLFGATSGAGLFGLIEAIKAFFIHGNS